MMLSDRVPLNAQYRFHVWLLFKNVPIEYVFSFELKNNNKVTGKKTVYFREHLLLFLSKVIFYLIIS